MQASGWRKHSLLIPETKLDEVVRGRSKKQPSQQKDATYRPAREPRVNKSSLYFTRPLAAVDSKEYRFREVSRESSESTKEVEAQYTEQDTLVDKEPLEEVAKDMDGRKNEQGLFAIM